MATTHADRGAQVAAILWTTKAEVRLRTHPTLSSPPGAAPTVDFFGVPIRAAYRESMRRRVSPRGLADRPYHRAAWLLRPFSFCAEVRDGLINA